MSRFSMSRAAATALLLGGLCLVGCGERIKLVPAEGVVKIDGTPAANIMVQFQPDIKKGGKGPTSFGTTDAAGKFKLRTHDGRDGAVLGHHLASLTDMDEERPPQGQPVKQQPRLDPTFMDPMRGIAIEVTGSGTLTLEANGPRR